MRENIRQLLKPAYAGTIPDLPEGEDAVAESRTVVVLWANLTVDGLDLNASPVALIEGYSTEADIPKILAIKHLGNVNKAEFVKVVFISEVADDE